MATTITVYFEDIEPKTIVAPGTPLSYRNSYAKGRNDRVDNMSIMGCKGEILTIQMNKVNAIEFKEV